MQVPALRGRRDEYRTCCPPALAEILRMGMSCRLLALQWGRPQRSTAASPLCCVSGAATCSSRTQARSTREVCRPGTDWDQSLDSHPLSSRRHRHRRSRCSRHRRCTSSSFSPLCCERFPPGSRVPPRFRRRRRPRGLGSPLVSRSPPRCRRLHRPRRSGGFLPGSSSTALFPRHRRLRRCSMSTL